MTDTPTLFDDWRNVVLAVRQARLTSDEWESVQASCDRLQLALEAGFPDGVAPQPNRAARRAGARAAKAADTPPAKTGGRGKAANGRAR